MPVHVCQDISSPYGFREKKDETEHLKTLASPLRHAEGSLEISDLE